MPKRMQRVSKTKPQDYASRLKVGQTFNSYAELCRHLNESIPYHTDEKASQLKKWSHYFTFKQNGKQITITDILSTPPEAQYYLRLRQEHLNLLVLHGLVLLMKQFNQPQLQSTTLTLCKEIFNYEHISQQIRLSTLQHQLPSANIEMSDVHYSKKLLDRHAGLILKQVLRRLQGQNLITMKPIQIGLINMQSPSVELPDNVVQVLHETTLERLGYETMTQYLNQFEYARFYKERNQVAQELFGYEMVFTQHRIQMTPKLWLYILQQNQSILHDIQQQIADIVMPRIMHSISKEIQQVNLQHQNLHTAFHYADNVELILKHVLLGEE